MATGKHGDIIRWNHFPRNWTFVRRILLTKASDAELSCYLCSAPWINGWVNNNEAGVSRRHRAHYDVIVMYVYELYGMFNILYYSIRSYTYIRDMLIGCLRTFGMRWWNRQKVGPPTGWNIDLSIWENVSGVKRMTNWQLNGLKLLFLILKLRVSFD